MQIRGLIASSIAWLPVLLLASCSSQYVGTVLPEPNQGAEQRYRLGPGDTVRILLYGDNEFSGEFTVQQNGDIDVPLIGDQQAKGLSISEFKENIFNRLANGYYRDPRLTVEIINYRPFYIVGEVKNPGQYPFAPGLDLTRAVAIAGGYTYRANTKHAAIQRENMTGAAKIRIEDGVKLQPGDTIKILERFF